MQTSRCYDPLDNVGACSVGGRLYVQNMSEIFAKGISFAVHGRKREKICLSTFIKGFPVK
jgi:hypothetical protein